MKNFYKHLSKTIPLLVASLCFQPISQAQDGGGGLSITISLPGDIATQANSKITLLRSGYGFDFVLTLTYDAANLLAESAGLLDDVLQNVSIDSSTLDTTRIFNRERLIENNFSLSMIKLGAENSGNEDIATLITSAIESGALQSTNDPETSYVGALSDVLNKTQNYNLLGLNVEESGVGDVMNLTTDDVEAFVGNNIDIAETEALDEDGDLMVDLSDQKTKIFAIAAANDLEIHNDVAFSKRGSNWDKNVLAIGAAGDLKAVLDATSEDHDIDIEYDGNYLGIGAAGNVTLYNTSIEAKHGIGIASLETVEIETSELNIEGNGGFALFAKDKIDLTDVEFNADSAISPTVFMEAYTIELDTISFKSNTIVELASGLGPIDGKYPLFLGVEAEQALPGRVNFRDVTHGGIEINSRDAFDQLNANADLITILKSNRFAE